MSGAEGLLRFSKKGELINRYGICNGYAASHDGEVVAQVNGDNLDVYKGKDKLFASLLPSPFVRAMAMSSNGNNLAVIDNQYMIVFDLINKRECYRTAIDNPIVLAASKDGNMIACAREVRGSTSQVTALLFNLKGEKLWEWSIEFTKDYETVHRIEFSEDRLLNIYSTDTLFRFRVNQ